MCTKKDWAAASTSAMAVPRKPVIDPMLIAPSEVPCPIAPPEPGRVPLMFRLAPSAAPEVTAASPVIVTGVLVVPPCVLAPPLKSTEPVIVVGAVRLKLKLVLEAPVIALPPPEIGRASCRERVGQYV